MANPEWDNYDPKRFAAIEALRRIKQFLKQQAYSEYTQDALAKDIREIEKYVDA